jgi:hypothetical protein
MKIMRYYICISILCSIYFSCAEKKNNFNTEEIINTFRIHNLKGEVVILGEKHLTISNDIVMTDSICTLIDLSQNDKVFRSYNLSDFSENRFIGDRGNGPQEFLYPISFNSKNKDRNSFCVFDLNLMKISEIQVRRDSVYISKEESIPALVGCFNINRLNDVPYTYWGTRSGEEASGLYFIYNIEQDSLKWIDYSSKFDEQLEPSKKYELYYNTLCIGDRGVIVALRYFNKVLFYDLDGQLKKEIQLGENALHPKWDRGQMDYSSKSYFYDMCTTDKYIYCLWVDDTHSKIFAFNWLFDYILTFQLDSRAMRLEVSNNDSFILTIVDDGTGLANVVKYDIGNILSGIRTNQ